MNFFLYFIWIFVLKKKFGHFISPKIAYLTFPALQFGSGNESSKSCGRIASEFGLRSPCHGWLGIGRTTLHSMSGFGTQQPSSYCQYETTQQSTQLVFLLEKNSQTVIHSGEKLFEKVSFFTYSVFKNSNATVLKCNKYFLEILCEWDFFLIFIHCALLCISKQWKNVPKAIIDFRDMEKNTHTKEFEKSCTNAILLCAWPLWDTLASQSAFANLAL